MNRNALRIVGVATFHFSAAVLNAGEDSATDVGEPGASTPAASCDTGPSCGTCDTRGHSLFDFWGFFRPTPTPRARSLDQLSTDQWVAELRKGPVDELKAAGEAAGPVLAAAMRDGEAATWAWHILPETSAEKTWLIPVYTAALHNPEDLWRHRAMQKLGVFGDAVPEAVPSIAEDLLALAEKEDTRCVLDLLENIRLPAEQALPILQTLYNKPADGPFDSFFSQQSIVKAMSRFGGEAVPALLEAIANTDSEADLNHLFRDPIPGAIPVLIASLEDKDVVCRRAAAWLLVRQFAPQSECALDRKQFDGLYKALDDADGAVRGYVLETLNQQPSLEVEVLPLLMTKFTDGYATNSYLAAQVVANLNAKALPALRLAAVSEQTSVRSATTVAIGSMRPMPESELSLLVSLMSDSDANVRRQAVYGLQRSGSDRAEVLEALAAALEDTQMSASVARALGALGPSAAAVLPRLEKQLEAALPNNRVAIALAIWRIDASSRVVLPALVELLQDTKTLRAGYSCWTKMEQAERVEVTTPFSTTVSLSAATALGEMGPAAASATKDLVTAAQGNDHQLAYGAIEALGKIGPGARESVPYIVGVANSQSSLNEVACQSLRQVAPEPTKKVTTADYGSSYTPAAD